MPGLQRRAEATILRSVLISHMLMIPKCDISFRVHKAPHCDGNGNVIPEVLLYMGLRRWQSGEALCPHGV